MEQECLNIIVVEDDAIIAQLIKQHLEEAGHFVLQIAHNSTKALEYIYSLKPELILLDIDLGKSKMDGIEIGTVINGKHQIPFIYLTAHSDLETINRAKETRPCGYIVKPYKSADLYSAISIGMYNYGNRQKNKTLSLEYINSFALQDLSQREYEILIDIIEGLTNSQIATKQFISLNTIKWHIQNLYSKMGIKNRTSLAKLVHEKS